MHLLTRDDACTPGMGLRTPSRLRELEAKSQAFLRPRPDIFILEVEDDPRGLYPCCIHVHIKVVVGSLGCELLHSTSVTYKNKYQLSLTDPRDGIVL